MRILVAFAAVLASMSASGKISQSQALRIARAMGDYAQYTPSNTRKIDYEITDKAGQSTYAGYITVQLMANGHAIFDMSINEDSGQVADFTRCIVFKYPVIKKVETQLGIHVGKQLAYAAMMGDNGCEQYHVLKLPGDEASATPAISTD